MTMLAVALPWTTASSINRRRATQVLPIAIGRPSSTPHRPLPKEAVNAPRQQTASAEIPIASDAQLRHLPRFPPLEVCVRRPPSARRRHHGPASENLHSSSHSAPITDSETSAYAFAPATANRSAAHPARSVRLLNRINLMLAVQSCLQKYFCSRLTQIKSITRAVPTHRGGVSRSSRTRGGMRWTRQRRARDVMAGRV
jgi:hypothetical protein